MAPFTQLPTELVALIVSFCDTPEIAALAAVDKEHHAIANPILYDLRRSDEVDIAMLWACMTGRLGTLKRLVEYGGYVDDICTNRCGASSTLWGCDDDLPQCLIDLLDLAPLALAAKYGQEEVVKWLIDHNAKIDRPAMNFCSCQASPDRYFAGHRSRRSVAWTPLHLAICNNNVPIAKLLISRGADPLHIANPPHRAQSALHTAAYRNIIPMIDFLVTQKLVSIDHQDFLGLTPLHLSVLNYHNITALERLVELGANLELRCKRGYGKTALGFACLTGNFRAALFLLDKGANPHICLRHDISPLTVAGFTFNSLGTEPEPVDWTEWEGLRQKFKQRLIELGVSEDAEEVES
ncbi:ankyrin repeat-containing domain protein [Hypoxylon fragiforme]|uniref:ankyrin repeat-containing domain protein n=1 Tax=Hypoxylon fragiforme TaxID=63214 RepID=UPI0020C742AB|nr:ankyrin repeat-containing domain protein [Hypoxylon fragiforme]KAI2609971.1 ankyrin repeat-containing domain protein [Hypoxylon fragiforme]